ncbi:MAG: hypothetical protein H0V66_03630 [Bdellovibrionales bacterium]|nr:hypothetical protein [Bdellovibrionales bacterium]
MPIRRTLNIIEDELDELQLAYINEDDEIQQLEIDRKFSRALDEATEVDNVLRVAAGVTINNWTRETPK